MLTLIAKSRFLLACSLAVLAIADIGSVRAAQQYSIDIVINPYHAGVKDSWFFDINNGGQTAGYIIDGTSAKRKPVIYRAGNVQVLGSGAGTIRAVNDLGEAIGDINSVPTFFAADGTPTSIVVPGKDANLFIANYPTKQINDSGNVLIGAFPQDPAEAPPGAFSGLAIWSRTGTQVLSALDSLYPYTNPPDPNDFNSGPSSSSVTANTTGLNNSNQFAAGVHALDFDPVDPANPDDDVFADTFTNAYIYDGHGSYHILAAHAAGEEIRPIDIDNAGTVLGWSGSTLALWNADGSLRSVLPAPPSALDDVGSFAPYPTVQRNNLGQIVGLTISGGVERYDPITDAWTDITPSIAGLSTGAFSTIQGFNDVGQFVGLVRPPQGGGVFGYVVSPVPEPSTAVLSVIGLAMIGRRRCRNRCC
jgi:hypothetical protein